jgi:Leucine-rich repeat (LRR) protein
MLCENERDAFNRLLNLDEINKSGEIESEIKNSHISFLKIKWMDLRKDMIIFGDLNKLENLKLINCELGVIPEEFVLMTELKSLTISFFDMQKEFKVEGMFPTIFFLGSLEELILERILIDENSKKGLKDLNNLINLQLNHCGLLHLPEKIHKLKNLKYLSLAGNNINEFPDSLFLFPKLEKFFIDNKIKGDYNR